MKKILLVSAILVGTLAMSGCNFMARSFGGEQTIELAKNQKFINVTWKEANIWVLTKPMKENDVVETYEFKEYSSGGLLEGKVILKESK